MCLLDCRCCGSSWRSWAGIVDTIAIIDILTSILPVTLETATIGTLTGIVVPLSERANCSSSNSNSSINFNNTSHCEGWLYQYVGDDIHFNFDTYTVTALILFILLGFIVEGYLYSMLRQGVHEKIYKKCKQWFYYRIFLLILVSLGSIAKILWNQYHLPTDGLLDIFKLYRIFTLIIVRCFMTELAETVGVIYIKPPKKAKRGSL